MLPGIEEGTRRFGSELAGTAVVGFSMVAGAGIILLVHATLPHEHMVKGRDTGADARGLRQVWLFVIAITLHNFPEGLSVGVGFGGGNVSNGMALTTAIFIQNMPEGFVVALALVGQGYGRARAVAISCGTGLVETVGGVFGAITISLASAIVPFGLGFAAGAMLFGSARRHWPMIGVDRRLGPAPEPCSAARLDGTSFEAVPLRPTVRAVPAGQEVSHVAHSAKRLSGMLHGARLGAPSSSVRDGGMPGVRPLSAAP